MVRRGWLLFLILPICMACGTVQARSSGMTPLAVGHPVVAAALRPPTAVAPALDALAFPSPERGFAGGRNTLLGTNDGGRSWVREWQGNSMVTQILPVSGATAYAVTSHGLLRTSTGGRTWVAVAEPGGGMNCASAPGNPCIVSATFPTPTVGYAVTTAPALVGTQPGWVAVSPHGRWLYTTNSSGTVTAYDLADKRIGWFVRTGDAPTGLALTPDGQRLYVANQNSNTVSVIDTAHHRVLATIPVVPNPCALAISPNGKRVFVASASGGMSVIAAATNKQLGRIAVGGSCGLAFSPSGRHLYVASSLDNAVSVVDPLRDTITATYSVPGSPWGVVVSADGRRLYVSASLGNDIVLLDAHTGRTVASWHVPQLPYGLALAPSAHLLFVATGQFMTALNVRTGHIVAKVPESNVYGGLGLVPGGSAVFAADGSGVLEVDTTHFHVTTMTTSGITVNDAFGMPIPESGGVLYRTADAGTAWQSVATPAPVQSVCFTDAQHGYVAGAGVVYGTSDGGRTWRTVYRAPVQVPSQAVTALLCHGSTLALQLAWLEGAMGHEGYIAFVSTDAGGQWHPAIEENYTHPGKPGVNAPEGPGTYPGPFTLTATGVPVYGGWVPAMNASLIRITSGGIVASRSVPGPQGMIAISFPSAADGFVLPAGSYPTGNVASRLLATTDGGRTWVQVYPQARPVLGHTAKPVVGG